MLPQDVNGVLRNLSWLAAKGNDADSPWSPLQDRATRDREIDAHEQVPGEIRPDCAASGVNRLNMYTGEESIELATTQLFVEELFFSRLALHDMPPYHCQSTNKVVMPAGP